MKQNDNIIRRALEQLQRPTALPADFTDRLMTRIRRTQQRRERLTACLLIVGGLGFLAALLAGIIWYFDLRLPALHLPSWHLPVWRVSAAEGRLILLYLYIGLVFLGLLLLNGYLHKKLLHKRS